ncbi:MAG: response regulator [Bacteroidota bacterium]
MNISAELKIAISEYFIHWHIYQPDSALHYINSIPSLDQLDPFIQLRALQSIIFVYQRNYSYDNAINYALKAIKLAKEIDAKYQLTYLYHRMANISRKHLNDSIKAYDYSQKALDIVLAEGHPLEIASNYMSYGDHATSFGNFDLASTYLDSAEVALNAYQDIYRYEFHLLFHLRKGQLYLAKKELNKAEYHILEARRIARAHNSKRREAKIQIELAKLEEARGQYSKVIEYLQSIFTNASEAITLSELEDISIMMYRANQALGKFEKALAHHEQWVFYKDSIQKLNNLGVVADLENKYRNQEQQNIINEQQFEIKQQQQKRKLTIGFLSALLAFVVILIGLFLRLRRSYASIKSKNQIIEQQSEALKQLDKTKSTFFANVSHELRTPLTLMLGPINTTLKSGILDNKHFTLLKKAQQSGKDLLKLISSILDLTKMEVGKLELQEEAIALFQFTRRIASAFQSYAESQDIEFNFTYEAESNLQLSLDKNKVETILNNLLSNAMKFTPKHGSVSFGVKDQNNQLKIVIQDSGRGIHSDDLPHIFNRFYQSRQATTRAEGGTGIGLALSQEYAKLMGGNIKVESELGKGSVFTLVLNRKEILRTLPSEQGNEILVKSPIMIMPEPIKSTASTNSSTILVVEDNTSLREYLQLILAPHYQVETAENGKAALELLAKQKNKIDLILSDIMMPEMDGYELLHELKNDDRYRHLPCVMLTARADLQDKLKALRIGVDDYLLKPFEEEELLVRIANLLQNRASRSQPIDESIGNEKTSHSPKITAEDQAWLEQLEKKLRKEIGNPNYNLLKMTADFNMSESTLARQLKRLTGLTPARYLKELRLNEARRIIETRESNTVAQIAQIAQKVGYKDATSFSRAYSKRFGKSPSKTLLAE